MFNDEEKKFIKKYINEEKDNLINRANVILFFFLLFSGVATIFTINATCFFLILFLLSIFTSGPITIIFLNRLDKLENKLKNNIYDKRFNKILKKNKVNCFQEVKNINYINKKEKIKDTRTKIEELEALKKSLLYEEEKNKIKTKHL